MKKQNTGNESPSRASIIFLDDNFVGWGPIHHLVHLATRLLDLELQRPTFPQASRLITLKRMLFRTSRGVNPGVIYIIKSPNAVKNLLSLEDFDLPRRFRALWIIDSFWTEWALPRSVMRNFDLVAYTQKGDANFYEHLAPNRAIWLGWGADVLGLGSAAAKRPVDVLRVGRQPEAWNDDIRSQDACEKVGLNFCGRPPFLPTNPKGPPIGHRELCSRYAEAKFLIAHSNLAAPTNYTHPSKEYLTARWTDALSAGATVAGVQPFGDASAEILLWPGATLDFDRIDLEHNVEALAEATANWTPHMAVRNNREALLRLDWRWRLKTLAEALNLESKYLDSEIERLEAAIAVAPS